MKMNKKLVLGIGGGIITVGLAFGGGSYYTKATTDWQTNAINKAQADLKSTADDKATSLSNKASTDINAVVDQKVSDDIKAKQDELNTLMEQYYQMKLAGLTDTQAFKDLETQIKNIQDWALNEFKYQIDQTFATQTK